MPRDVERRAAGKLDNVDREGRTIVGYAALFNVEADIGGYFREQISPGAFAASIGRGDDVRALIDHDSRLILGRSTAGTLRLSEDKKGLKVEIDLAETQRANDLAVDMERGDVSQMSFGFRAVKQSWDEGQDPPLRTVEQADLFDVSVVTFPAYEETEATLRDMAAAGIAAVEELRQARINPLAVRRRLRMDLGLRTRAAR